MAAGVGQAIDRRRLEAWLVAAAAKAARPIERVTVRIVSDREMTGHHLRHRGEGTTTDVLTFPASAAGEPIAADIVICADVAARAAGERGHPIERELLLYALHGLLHCAGFDDHDPVSHGAMHAEEDRILEAIGVGATFGPPRGPDRPAEVDRP